MTAPSLLLRLRNPKPSDVVQVRFTGRPKAVAAVARALASVATVTGMSHHVQDGELITVEAVCHRLPLLTRGGDR